LTPIRWLQLTTLAAAIYSTAALIDGLSETFNISRQLSGAIQASLGVGFILSGGACILERFSSRIGKQLAEAHEEREEFRRRFEALIASLAEHEQRAARQGIEETTGQIVTRLNHRLSSVD
jgi:hypothetical protein